MTAITLCIAGSDPSGGAGIQADIKTISATGSYAASVITALTAQNTQGVRSIYDIPASFIEAQLHSVLDDLAVSAIKIGMLSNEEVISSLAGILTHHPTIPIVLDPVMTAKSGHALLKPEALLALEKMLCPLATLITPNIPEAQLLLNQTITTKEAMQTAARELGTLFKTNVLLKGGHAFFLETPDDLFYSPQTQQYTWFSGQRIKTKNTHGTGCTLSSAIASYLAQGFNLFDAISKAKHYLTNCLKNSADFQIGHGIGPVNHFYCE